MKNKDKKFKARDGKKYTIHRDWCYNNIYFGIPARAKKKIEYIVIHYSSGKKDTAKNLGNYFRTNNERYAGAQFGIDEKGTIYQYGRLKDVCYSVGGVYEKKEGGSKYLHKCTNYNSISIELCGIADNPPTKAQIKSCKAVIDYIQKYRKHATKIIRHYDVNSKMCPLRYAGPSNSPKGKAWSEFKKAVM